MPEIYIDADACPVKNEIIRVAERHGLKINVASNAWIRFPFVNVELNQVVVEKTPDAADNWIADNVKPFDIVVTSDIPLASRCLAAMAFVVGAAGFEFTADNIGTSLGMRDFNAYLREIGAETKEPSSFTQKERSKFLNTLENIVQKSLRSIR